MLTFNPFSMQRDYDRPFKSYSQPNPTSNVPVPSYYAAPTMTMPPYMQSNADQMTQGNPSLVGLQMPNNGVIKPPSSTIQNPTSEHLTDISDSTPNRHPSKDNNGNPTDIGQTVKVENLNTVSSTTPPPPNGNDEETSDGFKPPPKKRHQQQVLPENKDSGYWEKRRKNNESAKRSRDARRMKEEQIAMRTVLLEQENLQLRTEVAMLRSKIEEYRCMLYTH